MAGPDTPLGLKGDFVRNGVFIEVEFGNVASMHRDFFKFQIANRSGAGAVGVLVVATDRFSRFFDSGVATFEIAERNRPFLAIGIQMPLWINGGMNLKTSTQRSVPRYRARCEVVNRTVLNVTPGKRR